MTYDEAIETAIKEVKDTSAQAYLKALVESCPAYGDECIRIQLLYCLCNMQYYRGETARAVKKAFKQKIKELEWAETMGCGR